MGALTFAAATLRIGLAIGAAGLAGRQLARGLGYGPDALGRLAAAVLAISAGLVSAELLGLAGVLRSGPLIALLIVVAAAAWTWSRAMARHGRRAPGGAAPPSGAPAPHPRARSALAAVAVAITLGQWLLATADALGGGMYNFDTLWYHMPFAAGFAQSGSITAIHFTQADPWVAYYPANSELVHAIGLVLVHGDLLSPLINLGWLAMLLAGAWSLGRSWQREPETLVAGCLLAGLPVLASTQPGEAFNDVPGLAMLVAGAALLVNRDSPLPAAAALGFALGVKFTFLVPGLILAALLIRDAPTRRLRLLAGGLMLATCGWWYLRNLIDIGNPLGTRLAVGPLVLPGPRSALARSSQQTVLSQVSHVSLWGSRFIPGLDHMFGVAWPLLALAGLLGIGLHLARGTPTTRALAAAAGAAALTYLVFPTGAAGLSAGTVLFEVNLRYATPALALALPLAAVALPRAQRWAAVAMVLVLAVAQGEPSLIPASPARHLAFLILATLLTGGAVALWPRRGRLARRRPAIVAGALGVAVVFAAGYGVQRHYLARRYRSATAPNPGLAALYRWAQNVSHARIALYGTVEQYPLSGALVTNRVRYLGVATGDGGYAPITNCAAWRARINAGADQYVVMTPGPTGTAPLRWTAEDPAAHVVVGLGATAAVFSLSGPLHPGACHGS